MNKNSLENSAPQARYMDFIAPKKKKIPAGISTAELMRKKAIKKPVPAIKTPVKTPVKPPVAPKKPAAAPKSPEKRPVSEAPDASSYSLGGKSPFLTSVTVDKRPLSNSTPEVPRKNIYEKPATKSAPAEKSPTKIVKKPKKSSGGLNFFIILLTIILGAIAGVAAYYLIPIK